MTGPDLEMIETCDRCGIGPAEEAVYSLEGKASCQGCLEFRPAGPRRKTHWQYIRSIKGSYLEPAPEED